MNEKFNLYCFVEGHGEIEAVPKLLYKILGADLLKVLKPHRIPRDKFINDQNERKTLFNVARKRVCGASKKGGVLILIDAEEECCKDFLHGDKMAIIRGDINKMLAGIPTFFVMAEKGYESWLAAGMGGKNPGNPGKWLADNSDKSGLNGTYNKIPDQAKLTSSENFDIDLASEVNSSFRRFCKRVLSLPQQEISL